MKRVWKFSDISQNELLYLHRHYSKPKTLPKLSLFTLAKYSNYTFTCDLCAPTTESGFAGVIKLFAEKLAYPDTKVREDLAETVSILRDELVENIDDLDSVLDEKGLSLFRTHSDGSAFVKLMKHLGSSPQLAIEGFNWIKS